MAIKRRMTLRNAGGFLSFGLVMGLLPLLAPSWFPRTGIDGTSTRALWLEVMGVMQTLLGGGPLVWKIAVPALVRWLAYVPAPVSSVPKPAAPVLVFEPPVTLAPAAAQLAEAA